MSITDLCNDCRNGDMEAVETILDRGEVDVNGVNSCGSTPLMLAMGSKHASSAGIVTRLLSIPHIRLDFSETFFDMTALYLACMYGRASLIAIFGQDSRCSPAIINMRTSKGETPVMRAVYEGYLDCVKELEKLPGTDFTDKNDAGESLIDMARQENHQAVLEYLLARNNQVATEVANNTLEKANRHPSAEMSIEDLCNNCHTGDMQTVETILARGEVDVNGVNQNGYTPLMIAMIYNRANMVTKLLSIPHTRLDCTKSGMTALYVACLYNSASLIAIFGQDSRCSPAIINMRDSDGETAVYRAVYEGYLDCVKELDKLPGTDFTTKTDAGESLIDMARKYNHQAVLEYLLARNNQVATEVANNTLERMHLRDIAEEMDNMQEMEAVMLSDKQMMQTRHEEEIRKLSEKQRKEVKELDRRMLENSEKRSELQRRMQACISTPAAATPNVPECYQ